MPKKYSKIDIGFFIFLFVFLLICVIEIILFIVPYYSFLKSVILLIVVSIGYLGYKNNFDLSRMQRNIDTLSSDGKEAGTGKYLSYFSRQKETIFYSSFIFVSCMILFGMLGNTGAFLPGLLLLFAAVFVFLKILGFTIPLHLVKSEPSNMNAVRFFLLSFALFFIIMKLVCDSFGLQQSERILMYICFSGIYIISGFLLFFRLKFSGIFRPYNILSALLVISLVMILGYNNGLGKFLGTTLIPEKQIVEDMNLPGIISDEASIRDIEYEQTLVSAIYDITAGIGVGSSGKDVSKLQKVLGNLQYFVGEVSGDFDEDTRIALRDALMGECGWPESTSGRFGQQAKECIDNLSISILKNSQSGDAKPREEIISQEVEILEEDSQASLNPQDTQIVSNIFDIRAGMSVGATGKSVGDLQRVLASLGYYRAALTDSFDENTRVALRNTLMGECAWPESTSGIFGDQAKECIDNLEVSISK